MTSANTCEICGQERSGRPNTFEATQTHFERKPAVRWHAPTTLVRAGTHAVAFKILGGFSDQRDTQRFLKSAVVSLDKSSQDSDSGIWFDYFADSGDGFEAGATVAALLGAEELTVPGINESDPPLTLRRGAVLVHGGDAVYPVANPRDYEDRFVGPMRAMLDHTCSDHPVLLGLPGNHDWMDGLNAWSKLMTQKGWIGGWRTAQERSYFATQLADRWWLLGLDAHLGEYLDAGQVEFFANLAKSFGPNTNIVLCVPTPTWVHQEQHPDAHRVVDYFIRKALAPYANVRVVLTGDLHHYSRYQAQTTQNSVTGDHLITAGGGGAFLSSSHWLPERVQVPGDTSRDPGKSQSESYLKQATYPTRQQSLSTGRAFASIAWRNGGFPALVGVIYWLVGWSLLGASSDRGALAATLEGLLRPGVLVGATLVGAAAVGATRGWPRHRGKALVVGGIHLGLHTAVLILAGLLSRSATGALDLSPDNLRRLGALLIAGCGCLLGTLVTSFAFFLADRFGLDHLFLSSGIRSTRYRNFVRMHIDKNEVLRIYPIGVDTAPGVWKVSTTASGPWFVPTTPLEPRLIERPIVVEPGDADAGRDNIPAR